MKHPTTGQMPHNINWFYFGSSIFEIFVPSRDALTISPWGEKMNDMTGSFIFSAVRSSPTPKFAIATLPSAMIKSSYLILTDNLLTYSVYESVVRGFPHITNSLNEYIVFSHYLRYINTLPNQYAYQRKHWDFIGVIRGVRRSTSPPPPPSAIYRYGREIFRVKGWLLF